MKYFDLYTTYEAAICFAFSPIYQLSIYAELHISRDILFMNVSDISGPSYGWTVTGFDGWCWYCIPCFVWEPHKVADYGTRQNKRSMVTNP